MSDELTPGATPGATPGFDGLDSGPDAAPDLGSGGTELATALRELAHDHETPVPVPGTEIRRRAGRRRRRRQVSFAAAGATAAGALALVLTVALTGGRDAGTTPPAASYAARTPPATAEGKASPVAVAATVDLGRREMSVEGRTLPISSGSLKTPTPTGLMTVTAKYRAATVPGDSAGWNGYDVKGTWVMRLRTPDDRTNYLLALTWDEKAPGNYDRTGGVIGLRLDDAMWLYEALKPGSVVDVVGSAPQETSEGTGTGTGTSTDSDSDSGAMATTPAGAGALEATPTERGRTTP